MSTERYRQSHRRELCLKQQQRYRSNPEKFKKYGRAHYYANHEKKIAYQRAFYHSHKEELRERHGKWVEANKEEVLKKKREYHALNKDRIHAYKRDYYKRHKDRIKAKSSAYAKAHPEVPAQTGAKRRAQKLKSQVDPSGIKEWMRGVRGLPFARCHWCGTKVKGSKIHFDHVVPLSRGGGHTIANLCVSCPDCNFSKHDRLIGEWMRHSQAFLPL